MSVYSVVFLLGQSNICGGTYVIYQHALFLQKAGYEVTLASLDYKEYLALKEAGTDWHPGLSELHFISMQEARGKQYDIAIFTWWRTIYCLPQIQADLCVYFVQSIESKFHHPSESSLINLINSTYTFNLPVITEATWIQDFLYQHYGSHALLAKNGIRKACYSIHGRSVEKKSINKLRVLIEGPLRVWYKNTDRTIDLCSQVDDIEVWLLTSTKINSHPKVDRVFSCIPIEGVADIYRSCDVVVKLSYVEGMFAPPLEMFHCGGTCIVYDVTGYDEYIIDGYNGIVIKTNDEVGVLDAIQLLKQDRTYLNTLKTGALETAKQWINWDESSRIFMDSMEQIIKHSAGRSSREYAVEVNQTFKAYQVSVKWINSFKRKIGAFLGRLPLMQTLVLLIKQK